MTKTLKYLCTTFICFSNIAIAYDFSNFTVNIRRLNSLNSQSVGSRMTAPLYTEIENFLNSNYQDIGASLIQNSLMNYNIGGGVTNYKGLTWSRPFANFDLSINRTVAPDLYSHSWISRDTLKITVKASTLLANLSEQGVIQIDDNVLAAFTGLEFTRSFEAATLVDSYKEGLYLNFNKFFFAFKKFNARDILNLSDGESLKKTDTLRVNTGGIFSVPIFTGFTVSAGALAQYSMINYINAVTEKNILRISSQKEKILNLGLATSLELDFFNLLKISLLSYELNYEMAKSTKVSLSLDRKRREEIKSSTEELAQIQLALNGKDVQHLVARDVSSIEERQSQDLSTEFELFLFGSRASKKTEGFSIQTPLKTQEFYRHTNVAKSYQQTILSKFLQGLFGKTGVRTERTKTLGLEYKRDFEHNEDVISTESFSFEISHQFFAKSLKRKRNRKRARYFLKYWSDFNNSISNAIENRKIKAPIRILSNFSFTKKGLDYFFNKSYSTIKSNIIVFCKNKSKQSRCKKRLNKRYNRLYKYNQKNTTINMDMFRDFISMVYNYSYKIDDFTIFFSKDTISSNGSINAFTDTGEVFNSYFKSGQLKRAGVISNFSKNYE